MSCDSKAAEDGSSERVRSWLSLSAFAACQARHRGARAVARPAGTRDGGDGDRYPRPVLSILGPGAKLKLGAFLVILIIIPLNIKVH